MSNFISAVQDLNQELSHEGLYFRFEGYIETWQAYLEVTDVLLDELFILSKELLAWSVYFEEVMAWVSWRLTTEQNKCFYFKSFYDTVSVTHPDFAKIKGIYETADRLQRKLKVVLKHLTNQHRAFRRAHEELAHLYVVQSQKQYQVME